jgi:parallel beta-helix repeat protein
MVFALWADAAQAATYYVARSGKNTNSCSQARSASTPKLTIGDAVGCLTTGDTLYVRGGDYDETLVYPYQVIPSGTSWSDTVRVAAYPGETVWMRPTSGHVTSVLWFGGNQHYIEIDGINLDASKLTDSNIVTISAPAWDSNDAHHIRIKNAELIGARHADPAAKIQGIGAGSADGTGKGGHEFINLTIHDVGNKDSEHAFYIGDSNVLIDGGNFYNIAGACFHLYNGFGPTFSNIIVRNTVCHDSLKTGPGQRHWGVIVANGSKGHKIYNNIFYNILADGGFGACIQVFVGVDTEIYNNTAYNCTDGLYLNGTAINTVVRNNVAYNNVTNFTNGGNGTVASNNSFSGVDPKFMNASAYDFRLDATSPLIDAGTTVGTVATDLAGTARPQGRAYDIGAVESSSAGTAAAPPTPSNLHIVQ